MRNLLYKAGKLGYLVPIVRDRFLLHEQITEFAQFIKQFIEQHGEISVNQLRDHIQYGRKLTVQLIEYVDRWASYDVKAIFTYCVIVRFLTKYVKKQDEGDLSLQ
ncbi:elongation factor SelB-like winged helix protein [Nicoletella semolina]|uniref:Elongation factor SelB-like winged helix protein n=1 Tax=Nicoletella semolina TaxID=271160 RepID=A0A4R2NBM6_9PAST|nr:hypothetical protein [Nicoletella semolina]TCP18448.1 elongation factor SelB-like winged helix protein [Nicoletella semolina]